MKLILGIESSCDETSVALTDAENRVWANVIASQTEIHAPYGGVVPELASRAHVEKILPLLEEALERAGGARWDDIAGVAVTYGPGLAGCLLVGVEFAKGIALARRKPLLGVNHVAGHLWSIFLRDREGLPLTKFFADGKENPDAAREFEPPYLGLIVSGGHTSLAEVRGPGDMETIGQTLDDAAGEAYDKVAKLLGLGYPGGPIVDRLAHEAEKMSGPLDSTISQAISGNMPGRSVEEWKLPRPMHSDASLDFSFSGLKTAVLRLVERKGGPEAVASDPARLRALCAAFQKTAVDFLLDRCRRALKQRGLHRLALTGGVACNQGLREAAAALTAGSGIVVAAPPPVLCTDNAAMIAALGFYRLNRGESDDFSLDPKPSLPLSPEPPGGAS